MTVAYVDASALTKLVLEEPDSVAMRRWYIESDHVLCSRIGIVETRAAAVEHDTGTSDSRRASRSTRTSPIRRRVGPSSCDARAIHIATAAGDPRARCIRHLRTPSAARSERSAYRPRGPAWRRSMPS